MTSIKLSAPAKINLFLKVINKRQDSYHNLLTLFERISLADTIKIAKIPRGIIVQSDIFITRDPQDNLAYKAARIILDHAGIKTGLKIEIKKRIPIAGGLAGGSSDAAAVLIGANRLYGTKIPHDRLMGLGRKLGADVPFFLLNASFAVGRSRGDRLQPMHSKKRFWHLLISPGFKISTKKVYEAFDEHDFALTSRFADVKIHLPLNLKMRFDTIESMLYNYLEPVVIAQKGSIGKIIKSLAHVLDKRAIVSGSGPSLFCLYRTRKEVLQAQKRLYKSVPARARKGWRIFVVKTT